MAIGVNNNYTEEMKLDIDYNTEILADDVLNLNCPETGTYTYLDAGLEQQIFAINADPNSYVNKITLDLTNISNDGTIKLYSKIDGVNYREIDSFAFTVATDSDGFFIDLKIPVNHDFKLTYTEGSDEGGDIEIPYSYVLEN